MLYQGEEMKSNESVGRLIACLYRHARSFLEKEMSEFKLGSGTYVFLLPLFKHDAMNQNELSKKLHIDKANTTRAIRKLIDLGYIKRERDENDNRAYKLFITPKAKQIKPEIHRILRTWTQIISSGLTIEEKKIGLELLEKMTSNAVNYKDESSR